MDYKKVQLVQVPADWPEEYKELVTDLPRLKKYIDESVKYRKQYEMLRCFVISFMCAADEGFKNGAFGGDEEEPEK